MVTLFLLVLGYGLGSIPTGVLVVRWQKGVDIRQLGSGNIGMTNVLRAVGKGAAALTLVGDLLKGLVPVALALLWLTSPWAIGLVGLTAIIGHMYPLFAGFHGGKGVATTLGVFMPLVPGPLAIAFLVWGACVGLRRQVSLGSLAAAASLPLAALLWGAPLAYVVCGLVAASLIWYRHHENIQRLLTGTEPTIGPSGVTHAMVSPLLGRSTSRLRPPRPPHMKRHGNNRKNNDEENGLLDVMLDEGDLPKKVAKRTHTDHPPYAAEDIEGHKSAIIHRRDPSYHRRKGSREWEETRHDNGHATISLIERLRGEKTLLAKEARRWAVIEGLTGPFADGIAGRIADDGCG
jgi:glycerol-3-phosphate acyltransferase PlsY